jgi:hypothetical protein
MRLPRLLHVRQHFPDRALSDIPGAVRRELEAAAWSAEVRPGARLAIGVGSRGISNIATIVKAVVDYWKSRGAEPFIIPVMGSHGAATAEGQADVLAHYGIIEQTMGVPVRSSLEVVPLGATPEGIEVVMDRLAYESDGVMLVSRIKWHTDFEGKLESGVHKMMAIGLGKFAGAQRYHTFGVRLGLEQVIRSVGRKILATGKMLGGLGILEDAYHSTAEVHALGPQDMERREEELLARVKSWAPRIPVREADLLIVDEMGKNISGAGLDTKVVNRSVQGNSNVWPNAPKIMRIFVRDLTPLSYGNAVGLGMADVITERLYNQINRRAMELNALTASTTAMARTPLYYADDRTCLEKVVPTMGRLDTADAAIAWIRNTLELDEVMVSENLRAEIAGNPELEILGEAQPIEFDLSGNLVARWQAAAIPSHTPVHAGA